MTRWFLTLCLICSAATAQAQFCTGDDLRRTFTPSEQDQIAQSMAETPFAEGNHWIARRGAQTIHVIGTMHLDDPRWDPVMAELAPVVAGVERLFVEMTDTDQLEMQQALTRQPEKVFITQGPTLPELLSEADWRRLSETMSARGVPGFMAAKMQPWMQSLMLGMPACALTNPDLAKGGLDMRLMQAARAADVPIQSLEGFDALFSLLATGTIEEQLDLLIASLPFAEDGEDAFATMAAFYFDQANAAAWEFNRLLAFRMLDSSALDIEAVLADFETKMLDTRNQSWMEPLLRAPEDRIAVAVGALHLMGEKGLLNLLSVAGFTLERAAFRSPS